MDTLVLTAKELQAQYPSRFEDELQEYSQYGLEYDWWDCLTGWWADELKPKGVDVDRKDIQFSGFWSQGDGASFTGRIDGVEFWTAHGSPPEYVLVVEAIKDGFVAPIYIERRSGHYSHENTVGIECDGPWQFDDQEFGDGIFKGVPWGEVSDEFDALFPDFLGWVEETCRDYMRDIYNELEQEYEYLTSAEAFIEHCEANDIEFTVEVENESCD